MIGDQQDILARLKATLPSGWFADETPVLDGMLTGLAEAWSWAYGFLTYVKNQTRILTATDGWLDIIAQDFFGADLTRSVGQSDDAFRSRIIVKLNQERATRAGLTSALTNLTGRTPAIFEPRRPSDTGCYGSTKATGFNLAYGEAGGWGSLVLPFQFFVTAYRPIGSGVAMVAGWGAAVGAYGLGQIQYASFNMVQGQVTDQDINNAVADVLPITSIGWMQISN